MVAWQSYQHFEKAYLEDADNPQEDLKAFPKFGRLICWFFNNILQNKI